MLTHLKTSLFVIAGFLLTAPCAPAGQLPDPGNLCLHYDTPAPNWEKNGLPIGNGQMGAMLLGGPDEARLQFNEESLWLGDEEDTGKYQNFGELAFRFVPDATASNATATNAAVPVPPASDYQRSLDLAHAFHRASWTRDGAHFTQEAFASFPAKVIVVRWTADKPGALSGMLRLADAHGAKTVAEGDTMTIAGEFPAYTYGGGRQWLPFHREAQVRLRHHGGSVAVQDGAFIVNQADSVTLLLAAGTDFKQDRAANWRGELPHAAVTARLEAASKQSFDALLAGHERDYHRLFDRVSLSLGGQAAPGIPTDVRLKQYRPGQPDLGLEELLFQYGRYLLISSSREGGLPANLQGKWNNKNNPPWRCDYHTDVNVEMNYWMADVANLSECFQPYAAWINSIRAVRTEAAKKAFPGARGWTMRGESGLFGGSTWDWVPGTSAWLLQNSYDHYRFTMDQAYLRDLAYPAMKEVSEFWLDQLKTLADGTLVTPTGFSPEHGPKEDGISFDMQLAWDVFNSTIEAAEVLGVDKDFHDLLVTKRDQLSKPKIGKWGQLQEWLEDIDDPNDHHRHTSHLIAVFPGRQISVTQTPELAHAAAVSLDARGVTGDSRREWAFVWRTAIRARLGQGDQAHFMAENLFQYGLLPNLFATHPPFQMDGNFGYVAGVCEMLLQSHAGEIQILPALPKVWPTGSLTGLRARGGFAVDIAWKDGQLITATIHSLTGRTCKLRYGQNTMELKFTPGQSKRWNGRNP